MPMPSTMIIMPMKNTMVDQLMPEEELSAAPGAYQNSPFRKHSRFRVFQAASGLCMHTRNTRTRVQAAPTSAGM